MFSKLPTWYKVLSALSLILMVAAAFFPAETHEMALALGIGGSGLISAGCAAVGNIVSEDCGANPGGTVNIWVARRRDVESIPAPTAGGVTITTGISMKVGKYFAKWEFAQDTGNLNHKSVGDPGNKSVSYELNTYVPRGNALIDKEVNNAINGDYIVIVEDGLGQKRIAGSLLRGVIFDHDYNTGTKGTDKNGTAFKFLGEGFGNVPYYYDAAIPTLENAV
jgi:hypothetical protein